MLIIIFDISLSSSLSSTLSRCYKSKKESSASKRKKLKILIIYRMRIIYAYQNRETEVDIVNERTRREAIRKGRNACCVVLLWWYANAQTGEFLCFIINL